MSEWTHLRLTATGDRLGVEELPAPERGADGYGGAPAEVFGVVELLAGVNGVADRRVIACNYAVSTSACRQGALCYYGQRIDTTNGSPRVMILARSRSGRWVQKWERLDRLTNFRMKTLPPEHPQYRDMRVATEKEHVLDYLRSLM